MDEKARKYIRNYIRMRYHNDPEFKSRWNARVVERRKERALSDPEYAEKRRKYLREYLKRHPEKRREYNRRYRATHKEEIKAYQREYRSRQRGRKNGTQ